MTNFAFTLMDTVALVSAALDKDRVESQDGKVAINALFDVWVTEANGDRTLIRENVLGQLAGVLVSQANHGAKIQGLARTYEAVQRNAASTV